MSLIIMSASQGDAQADPDAKPDVSRAVKALVEAAQQLQEDAASVEGVENLIERLKHLLAQEKQQLAYSRQNSENRFRISSLQNLIQHLESQVQRARKVARRRGLKYYLASISNTVLGHELGRIGQSMESELQSWLDQQGVRELVDTLCKDSEDAKVKAISSFEAAVRKGYDAQLQDTILSAGLVERLSSSLRPGAASWRVQREGAFALCALLEFNKDIFVSMVIMAKFVENILSLMSVEPDEHVLILVCVLKSALSAGKAVIVDEIYSKSGVEKIVVLLDHKPQPLQHAAMDCVFELAYYGRIEVVKKMLELEVIQKLAKLEHSNMAGHLPAVETANRTKQGIETNTCDLDVHIPPIRLDDGHAAQPFTKAVTRFALHLAIGTGLRKRERRALKLEFLKQIKDVMHDDAEIANITAEVLWAP